MSTMSLKQYKEMISRPKDSKCNNVRTKVDGITFDSAMEAERYIYNKIRIKAGELKYQLLQPRFELMGVTYRADFQEVYPDNTIRYIDVKGQVRKEFVRSKKQVEQCYPVEIECVRLVNGRWMSVDV